MSWTTPENIKALWIDSKALTVDDEKIQSIINTFERQVEYFYPKIQERIDANNPPLSFVQDVVAGWVIEYIKSEGTPYSSETQSYTGYGSRTVQWGDTTRRTLKLSKDDLSILGPSLKTGSYMSIEMGYSDHKHFNGFYINEDHAVDVIWE